MSVFLVRCRECGREESTSPNPLRDGWPTCCGGYSMFLVDEAAFTADIDRQMGEILAPVRAAIEASGTEGTPDAGQ